MSEKSAYQRRFSRPYRTPFELLSGAAWLAATLWLIVLIAKGTLELMAGLLAVALTLFFALWRLGEGAKILNARALLSGYRVSFMSIGRFKKYCRADQVLVGYGFEWKPEHSQKLYELSRDSVEQWMLPAPLLYLLGRSSSAQPKNEIGLPWLHGLEPKEKPLYRALKDFEGGTALIGTTQAGKGVLLISLITQAIARGDAVIVIDPKFSSRLLDGIHLACKSAKRKPPFVFHPNYTDKGVRLDPLQTWSNSGEIASRIAAMLPADTDGSFRNFAWSAVDTIARCMIALGQKPTIRTLTRHINGGVEALLHELLRKFKKENPTLDKDGQPLSANGWEQLVRPYVPPRRGSTTDRQDELLMLAAWYEHIYDRTQPAKDSSRSAIEAALKVYRHSKEHYAKITASLMPILSMITSGPLEKSLSPDPWDKDDRRPITNLEEVIQTESVLVIGLDSLPNPAVASAIGAIFLAELAAVAGKRYALRQKGCRISLFVDETSNVINRPLIEILNKGAEGGISSTCAMQTIADLAHSLGSQDAARMVLGNLNNLIALRSKDRPTQDFITETFGKTYISQVDTTLTSSSETTSGAPSFDGGASHKHTSSREELIPSDYLGRLPNCEFFASVGGGFLLKGRIPILYDDSKL